MKTNERTNERTSKNELESPLGYECYECGKFVTVEQSCTNQHDKAVCKMCLIEKLTHIESYDERQTAIEILTEYTLDVDIDDSKMRDLLINGNKGYDKMTNQELFAELIRNRLIDETADRVQSLREELIEYISGPDIDMTTTIKLYAIIAGE